MSSRSWVFIALVAAVTLGGMLRFLDLGAESLWIDELFSVRAATREDWAGLIDEVRQDVHPPLYFALLRVWIGVAGVSEVAVRTPSAVFGTLSIVAVFALGRRLWNAQAGVAGAWLVAVAPFVVELDREARGNALLSLLAVVSTVAATFPSVAGRVTYAVVACAMLWTHAFGFAVVAAHGIWAALDAGMGEGRARVRRWIEGAGIAGVLYVPWASTFLAQTQTFAANPWYQSPAGDTFGWLVPSLSGGAGPAAVVALGVILLYARGGSGSGARLLPAALLGVVLLPHAVSMAVVPVLRDRNVLPILPLTMATAGAGFAAAGGVGVGLVAVAVVTEGLVTVRARAEPDKEQWREAAAHVRAGWRTGDRIDANHPNLWRHYLPEVDAPSGAVTRTWVIRAHEGMEGPFSTELGHLVEETWFRGAAVRLFDRAIVVVPIGSDLSPPMWDGGKLHYYWNQSVRSPVVPIEGRCSVGVIGFGEEADGLAPRVAVRIIAGETATAQWDVDMPVRSGSWWSPEVETGPAAVEIEFLNDGAGVAPDGSPADRNVHIDRVMVRCTGQ